MGRTRKSPAVAQACASGGNRSAGVDFLLPSLAYGHARAGSDRRSCFGSVHNGRCTGPAEGAGDEAASPVAIEQVLYLIRSTLLTLNDANRSGNYSVLRDLAAPDFQAKNTAADLAQIFSDLRRRNFDLYSAALLAPQLTAAPALDPEGKLRLTGFFPTRPLQISFDLLYQTVGGQWRLFGISIATPTAPPQVQAPPSTGAPAAPSAKAQKSAPAPKSP